MAVSNRNNTRPRAVLVAAVAGFLTAASVAAQTGDADHELELLPLEDETRLALSAAPDHLRDDAGVWALTPDGWSEVKSGSNGFTCVVNRDHPLNWKPTCYDPIGTAAVLPKVKFFGERLLEGMETGEIQREVQARFDSGEFVAPAGPGIAYMLSTEIRNYNPRTGEVGTFPPHVMFYAPNLTNEDVGATFDSEARAADPWLPFVAYQGPHGFIIVVVESPGDG